MHILYLIFYICISQFCQLTRDGEVYHDYCLNYSKAVNYLEQMRKNDEFCDFEKVRDTTLMATQRPSRKTVHSKETFIVNLSVGKLTTNDASDRWKIWRLKYFNR